MPAADLKPVPDRTCFSDRASGHVPNKFMTGGRPKRRTKVSQWDAGRARAKGCRFAAAAGFRRLIPCLKVLISNEKENVFLDLSTGHQLKPRRP